MNKKRILTLLTILILFTVIPIFTDTKIINNNDSNLKTSTDNYIFNGKDYTFDLDDVYDDENSTKIYTGANFQTVFLENESTTLSEEVSPVNNTNYKSPSNTGVNMIDGTFDDTDNMKANDDSNSEFTSTKAVAVPDEFIDNIDILDGTYQSGAVSDTWIDNGVAYKVKSLFDFGMYWTTIDLNFDPAEGGRNFLVSAHLTTDGNSATLYMNGGSWKTGVNIDFDDEVYNGLTSIRYSTGDTGHHYANIYYLKIVEIKDPVPAELNFTIDLNFNEVQTEDLLALDVSSYHFTNISTDIIGNIYNYDSGTYTQMFSSSNTVETENYFSDESSVEDYLDGSGNLRLYFTGINSVGTFKQIIDYIKVRFYYKMDLTHTISFETNGLWKYRWELIGSLHYTDWTYFEVVDPVPNFDAISQSGVLSRWILQDNELTAVEDFHDDINTDYWNLVDVSLETMEIEKEPTDDSYISSPVPDVNYGTADWFILRYSTPQKALFKYNLGNDYLIQNCTSNNTLSLYFYYVASATDSFIYAVESFDESIVTWNNQPSTIQYIGDTPLTASENWYVYDAGNNLSIDSFRTELDSSAGSGNFHGWTTDKANGLEPYFTYFVSKNYFGSGYTYMQTNTIENIGLKSVDYGAHKTLSSGDYFEVDFQTNSDSQIDLVLLKNGVVNKTLILSQSGNTNFNRHTVQISVSEELEFDQLKIVSTFEDQDNIKVYDIKTFKYTLTGDYEDFYVSPNNQKTVYLTPDTYNLRIFEEGDKKTDVNITIPVPDDYLIYSPLPNQQCRLGLFSPDNIYLPLTDYHIDVNRSLNGEYNQFALLGDVFNVDMGTYIYIDIYDRFNTLIDSFTRLASDYIDLELEVYQLRVKSLLEYKTTVNINSTNTYELLPYDYIEFMLATSYYLIGYYDDDNDYREFAVNLNSNQAYSLNKSELCFLSYADQQGNHLSFDNYKTYINGSMIYEQIFYEDAGDDVNITITDRYDYEVYQDVYVVTSGDNYIPITLIMYSLKVMNQQENFNHINITRDPNNSEYFWSEWIAPGERIEFKLFAGDYIINLTDTENGWSSYGYELNGDDTLLFTSDNIISNVLINIANVNVSLGNQITNVQIDLTNQNSEINNSIINVDINISNLNSSLGNLLVNLDLGIINIANNISSLFVFTNNSFLNLNNQINNSFIYMENRLISINQSVSTLVIGLDGKVSIVNATINTMWTEMSNQFIVTQSTLNFSFAFLNQTIVQIGNNITDNKVALQNLIIQRANEIDNSLIEISTLINLINSSVVNESLIIQSLVNIIGSNITENHVIINNLINLLGNNITENNINLVSLIELTENNITTNQFVIQTLIDYVSNNITENNLELLTNINLINNTIDQNQIELINRLLFINNSINEMALDLTNQIIFVNDTIYSAILDVSTSLEFNSDCILGNISLTYQQNDFLTELYKETMFSQLLNFSGVAYNYSLMEDRIDVWEFINDYRNDSITVFLKYGDLIDNLTITSQNSIEQYLPSEDVEYRLKSVSSGEYLTEWTALPENKTVNFGFFETDVPIVPRPLEADFYLFIVFIIIISVISIILVISWAYMRKERDEVPEDTRLRHKRKKRDNLDWRKNYFDQT